MDINLFSKMIGDAHFSDYKKMRYKYGDDFDEFLSTLEELFYRSVPLDDGSGKDIVYIESCIQVDQGAVKLLLQGRSGDYGIKAAEDEIVASSAIESVDISRESVRRVLGGMAPKDEQEGRILGFKKGLEFIADTANAITQENIHALYMMAVSDFLTDENKLMEGEFYRHDSVYVVGGGIEHSGVPCRELPKMMGMLVDYINTDSGENDLIKAAIIHFYIAYLHPYFDGNGRMARLIHLWFLIRRGYRSALFVPFSSCIERSRGAYYKAFSAVEDNRKYSGRIDVTPFILYFAQNVYGKMSCNAEGDLLNEYRSVLNSGKVTPKEAELWNFVISRYGTEEFSTKQLEKDYGDVAYATVRSFVMKFKSLGLLSCTDYGGRKRYRAAE